MAVYNAHLIRRHATVLLGLLVALVSWAFLNWGASRAIYEIEERAGDLVWRFTAKTQSERRLILVDIDERSLQQVGTWPWPRATQAQLINQIAALGAREQILDIVFASDRPGDRLLAEALARHQPVLAQVFALEANNQATSGLLAGALDWSECPQPFQQATGYLANPVLLHATKVGHITPRIADDGVLRHQPAVICYQGKSYPALGLAAFLLTDSPRNISLQPGNGWLQPAWQLTSPALIGGRVPLEPNGDLRVPWRLHPDSFISLSAVDVLAGNIPPNLLENAWVLIGSSAFGLNDVVATPFSGTSSGLQAHLQIIVGLIDERIPYTPTGSHALQVAAAALGLLLLLVLRHRSVSSTGALAISRFPEHLLPLVAILWGVVLWMLHAWALVVASLWVGWLQPALLVVLIGGAIGILDHAKSRFDRDQLYSHLSSYLPAPVAAALALQPPSSAIKASTQQVSVLFADIRNFSAYCEARPPEEAAAVLHAFFSTATRVIERHGGVIESFQGDAIIAVWNGNLPPSDASHLFNKAPKHPQQALQAAINLLSAMHGVLPDPAPAGLEPLSLGIGVETGAAMTGSFGLSSRRTHMVMGRTVTIASRLVDMTVELAHPILVGEGLAAQVGGMGLQSMGTFLLDGLRVPHHIYAHPLSAPTSPSQ